MKEYKKREIKENRKFEMSLIEMNQAGYFSYDQVKFERKMFTPRLEFELI